MSKKAKITSLYCITNDDIYWSVGVSNVVSIDFYPKNTSIPVLHTEDGYHQYVSFEYSAYLIRAKNGVVNIVPSHDLGATWEAIDD